MSTFASLGPHYSSLVATTPLDAPQLLHFNHELASQLGLDAVPLEVLAGNQAWPDSPAVAMLYAGHQFGQWVPQLGDGRALLIASLLNPKGERWDLQLKGAGATPYSRHADGRAVLRSSIREYLCSAAMKGLGIPTTQALSLVGSSTPVRRETMETAAVVCRVAPSFVRFGNFEVFYYREQHERLKPLADHVIAEFYPQHAGHYAAWLKEVVERTARLMAQWQCVGFCHGVMNTDNFSILGLTLDYGPFGFMDGFDAGHICNHSDEGGRYAYDQQPAIGHWNCSRLLQACLPLLSEEPEAAVEIGNELLNAYAPAYAQSVTAGWQAKFGLRESRKGDAELFNRFLTLLHRGHDDFTLSFRRLGQPESLRDHVKDLGAYETWLIDYRSRLAAEQSDDAERAARMNAVNPLYILRNHLLQACIEQAQRGEFGEIERLMQLARRPYTERPGMEAYASPPPAGTHISVSCSS